MDEGQVEWTVPGRDVIHNKYNVRVYQQQGENAKEDSRRQECLEHLKQVE
jgi:hypothetical protein